MHLYDDDDWLGGDDDDWMRAVSDVKPLREKKKVIDTGVDDLNAKDDKPAEPEPTLEDLIDYALAPDEPTEEEQNAVREPVVRELSPMEKPAGVVNKTLTIYQNEAACLSGADPSLDVRTLRRLGKGEIAFTRNTDLHGLFIEDAWQGLMAFLHQAYEDGERCVLVVHGKGKGYGPKMDMGAIKSQMASWLAACPVVMGFHSAIPRHGGAGAVYVLLRRQR